MECQVIESKKLLKVFDAAKRRSRKKNIADDNSVATDESVGSGCHTRVQSTKGSYHDVKTKDVSNILSKNDLENRERDSSPSASRSPVDCHRKSRSSRARVKRKEGVSLALKGGCNTAARSISPFNDKDLDGLGSTQQNLDQDQDYTYTLFEEAVKRDKKKRHFRHHVETRSSRDHEDRHHHHRRHRDESHDKKTKEKSPSPSIDQSMIMETFAKLFAHFNDKSIQETSKPVTRTLSHKSLQYEDMSRGYNDPNPIKHATRSRDNIPTRVQSRVQGNVCDKVRSHEDMVTSNVYPEDRLDKCRCIAPYDKGSPKYMSTLDTVRSRIHTVKKVEPRYVEPLDTTRSRINYTDRDRYNDYPIDSVPVKSTVNCCQRRNPDQREYIDDRRDRYERYDDRKRYYDQKINRSFDVHKEEYDYRMEKQSRRDKTKERRCEDVCREKDRRYERRDPQEMYYDERQERRENYNLAGKDCRSRRNLERYEKNSVVSRDDDYKERCSERERDSGLSVADGETSTLSGRSNCLKVVKQEIAEQREAMDKMIKLWKDLMRCFKGIQKQGNDNNLQESAENARDSAAAQIRLWRECMRRYETVARDVGDTDARLMEEITKQRSEMAEMATMWQECLQRYREMSNDFNNLKQKLATSESPTRQAPPLICAEGEGGAPFPPYRMPPSYPPAAPMPGYPGPMVGSALRQRASAPPPQVPPPWWWCPEDRRPSPRRRSSPESRASRERDRKHRQKERERDDSRYKEKSSKPSAARSEHRRRKR